MQVARFRRGDSMLVVSAFKAADDSLLAALPAVLGVAFADGTVAVRSRPRARAARATLMVESFPLLAGVEVTDTTTSTLARSPFAPSPTRPRRRARAVGPAALPRRRRCARSRSTPHSTRAVPGDTIYRERPIGIYWETYGIAESGESSTSASPSSASIGAGCAARSRC